MNGGKWSENKGTRPTYLTKQKKQQGQTHTFYRTALFAFDGSVKSVGLATPRPG